MSDIANGGVGGVPAKIEGALGKAVPLVISFLANLLGLGGISDKIKSILKAVQAPINKALDFVIKGALKLAGPLIKGVKGIGAKVKEKISAGKAGTKGTRAREKTVQEIRARRQSSGVKSKREGIRKPSVLAKKVHSLIATSGPDAKLMIASEPKRAVATMKDELERAEKSNDQERVSAARALLDACSHLETRLNSAVKSSDDRAIAEARAEFGQVLGALKSYGRRFNRRGLVEAAELEEGSIRPYNLQPKGGKGKFEHEHIVPGALFAAWMGLERASGAISTMYKSMMTVTWKYKTARVKTANDAAKWNAMKVKRDEFLGRPDVAKQLKGSGKWKPGQILPNPPDVFGSLDDLKKDRVDASVTAAQQTGSKVTSSQIEATAAAQLLHLKALFRAMRGSG